MLIAISYFGCSVRIEDVNLGNNEIKKILKKKETIFYFPNFFLRKHKFLIKYKNKILTLKKKLKKLLKKKDHQKN